MTIGESIAKALLNQSGLSLEDVKVSIRQIDSNGFCKFSPEDLRHERIKIIEYTLDSKDIRPFEYKIKTALHEFYHANADGLKHDWNIIGYQAWLDIEETATETAANFLLEKAGIKQDIMLTYSEKLVKYLPKLKKLDEFKDCKTIKDFGRKFLKYRFSDEYRTAEWEGLFKQINNIDLDFKNYANQYKDYVMQNKKEIVDVIYESLNNPVKKRFSESEFKSTIENSIDNGWEHYSDIGGPGFSQSLLWAMIKMGVK